MLFPEKGNPMNDKLWTLWRNQKEAVRADGFGVGKDDETGNWVIKYFTDATPDSKMLVATADGRQATCYIVDFGKKCEKWEAILKSIEVSPKKAFTGNYNNNNKTLPYQAYAGRVAQAPRVYTPNNNTSITIPAISATPTATPSYLQNMDWSSVGNKNTEYIEDEDF